MRIWHPRLIPKLCTRHLVAMWREANGAYKIITEGKKGYSKHPATKEYANCPEKLHAVLTKLKSESISRGYNFKQVPVKVSFGGRQKVWQTYEEQVARLKEKGCPCLQVN